MGDNSVVVTPNSSRYELRSRTPSTPRTPATPKEKILRSTSTPITSEKLQRQNSTPKSGNTPCTPIQRILGTPGTPKTGEKMVFRTPMAFKPRIVGNRPVPSPSRPEMWKQQLGLTDDPSSNNSDKENSSSEDEENQICQTSTVEYRALQKVLAEKNAQRDETLLQIKNCKDKIRHYKARLEREETTKKQQLKIMRKTHEVQVQEKEQLIDNLQSVIEEQEERIKELEENVATTPRKKTRQAPRSPTESTVKLVDEIKRLQTEKSDLAVQLNEVQFELSSLHEDSSREILSLKETVMQLEKGRGGDDAGRSLTNNQSVLSAPCSTDTEKQVDVLLAENEQLLKDLTEARNAHTKAVTVSKLSNHRQQQLEEEIKRLKQKLSQLEEELKVKSERCSDHKTLQQEVISLNKENTELHQKIREIQAEIFVLHAKSPEVVRVTKVKEVESENLRKKYEESKSDIQKLKQCGEETKDELHAAQTQVKYLERMLKMTQSEKEEADSTLWKEMESLNTEHQTTIKTLRLELEHGNQEALQKLENRLNYEHKKELHEFQESLRIQHESEISSLKELQDSLRKKHETELSVFESDSTTELSKLKEERDHQLSEVEMKKNVQISKMVEEKAQLHLKFEEEKTALDKKNKLVLRQLEEDLTIAKSVAITKLQEEFSKDKENCLKELQEKLTNEHNIVMTEMEEKLTQEREISIKKVREETIDKITYLEEKYNSLVQRVSLLRPVISDLIESYICLKQEVKQFPKIVQKTITKVRKEMTAAITGISEYNKELVIKYQKEMKLRKKYHNELVELKGNIRVFCRIRPLIKEDGHGQQAENIVSLDQDDDGVLYINSKGRTQTFDVDKVFGETSTQDQVFDEVKALVTSCIDGYNVCIFAYGQTGSGKTYTMEGTKADPGINQRALALLFKEIESRGLDWEHTITVSVVEIYNEMIRDLLNDDTSYKMEVKMNPEGGYHIPGLSYVTVNTVDDVNECFNMGQQNRATAATNMNEHSSRSHALLCVTVIGTNKTTAVKTTGRLNLVDLAGSERVSKSKADGARLKEAQSINKSLSCLGDVIFALRSKQSYIPYRNSKLTYLLQDSLGGDSKTLMITQIAPVRKNEGESICSLNFAQRVRNVELGAATRKLENGDVEEGQGELKSAPSSPARSVSTPQSRTMSTPQGRTISTPQQRGNTALKPSTPSSNSKLTPVRQIRKK